LEKGGSKKRNSRRERNGGHPVSKTGRQKEGQRYSLEDPTNGRGDCDGGEEGQKKKSTGKRSPVHLGTPLRRPNRKGRSYKGGRRFGQSIERKALKKVRGTRTLGGPRIPHPRN